MWLLALTRRRTNVDLGGGSESLRGSWGKQTRRRRHKTSRDLRLPSQLLGDSSAIFLKRFHTKLPSVFENPLIVMSSVSFETFGDSFLSLENSFRFFQSFLHCKYQESERI